MSEYAGSKEDLTKRLRRIEGQVRGVAGMVETDRDCREVLQQLAAIRSAVNQVSLLLARSYACQCLADTQEPGDHEALVDDLINVLGKAT
jgi:DNA-binding FrmR family transcriptional regulator